MSDLAILQTLVSPLERFSVTTAVTSCPVCVDPLLYNTVVCTEYNHCTAAEIHLYRTGHPCNPCNRLFQQAQSAQRFGNTIPPLPGVPPLPGLRDGFGKWFLPRSSVLYPSNCAHFSRKCCAQRGFDANGNGEPRKQGFRYMDTRPGLSCGSLLRQAAIPIVRTGPIVEFMDRKLLSGPTKKIIPLRGQRRITGTAVTSGPYPIRQNGPHHPARGSIGILQGPMQVEKAPHSAIQGIPFCMEVYKFSLIEWFFSRSSP